MAAKGSGIWWAVKTVFVLAFFGVYGLVFFVRAAVELARRLCWGMKLLGQSLPCPYCHRPVPLVGRFICSSPGCGAEYQGFIQACNICGNGCLWTPCPSCNGAVQVGMRI